jgi:phosphoglycolate phosphatase
MTSAFSIHPESPSDVDERALLVMFDLDGTLSNSAPGILSSMRHAFAVNGLPPLDDVTAHSLLGPPFYESLPPLIGVERLPGVIAAYRDVYGSSGMFDTTVYDGMTDVLARLQAAGIPLAVATSKPEAYAVPTVEYLGLAGFFATIGGDELDGSLGTKALVIGKVLDRMGHPDPARVLMVGDRSHDVEGARVHGIATIAVGWGYAQPGELAAAHPAAICASAAELARVLGLDGAGVTAL